MARRDIEAGGAFVRLFVRSTLRRGLARASQRLKSFGSGVARVGAGVTAAGTAIVGSLGAAISQFQTAGDAVQKMAIRTGLSTEALSELGFAAEQSGTSMESLGAALFRSQRRVANAATGTGPAVRALEELGLSAQALTQLTPEQQFDVLVDSLKGVENESRAAQLAFEIFGDNARDLTPLLKEGSDGIAELRNQARELGRSISQQDADAAAELGDAMNRIRSAVGAAAFSIGSALAPAVIEAVDAIGAIVTEAQAWIRRNGDLVRMIGLVGVGLVAAGGAITAVGGAFALAGVALSGVVTTLGVLAAAAGVVLSPIGLLTAAVIAGVAAWVRFTESGQAAASGLRGLLGDLARIAGETFGGIRDALSAGDLALAGRIAVEGLRLVFLEGLAALSSSVDGVWGDLLGGIGASIAGGDFQGAWEQAVAGMAALWDSFAGGVLETFTAVARRVTEVWQRTVESIANRILDIAGQGGVVGDAFSAVLGVDVAGERRRREQLNARAAAAGLGVDDFDQAGAVSAAVSRSADAVNQALDQIDQAATAKTRDAFDRLGGATSGGASRFAAAIQEARAGLAAAREAAAAQNRAAAEARAARGAAGELPAGLAATTTRRQAAAVSFSAVALAALGQGGGPQQQTVQELRALRREAVEQKRAIERQIAEFQKVALTWTYT